jgi:hypothetical protein
VATIDANVRRKTMTGALSRLTKDSIVTTNFHSNNVQACKLLEVDQALRKDTQLLPKRLRKLIE